MNEQEKTSLKIEITSAINRNDWNRLTNIAATLSVYGMTMPQGKLAGQHINFTHKCLQDLFMRHGMTKDTFGLLMESVDQLVNSETVYHERKN